MPANKMVLDQCISKGEPYTTKEMFKQSMETESKEKGFEFYTENCKMNNAVNVGDICEGNHVSDLTQAQIQKVKTEKCKGGKAPKVSPGNKKTICMLLAFEETIPVIIEDMKSKIPDLTADDINNLDCTKKSTSSH